MVTDITNRYRLPLKGPVDLSYEKSTAERIHNSNVTEGNISITLEMKAASEGTMTGGKSSAEYSETTNYCDVTSPTE